MESSNENNKDVSSIEEKFQSILLSTGNINREYLIRDIIFATDRVFADLYASKTNPNDVFKRIYFQLKEIAYSYKADAVINCHFEQRSALYEGEKVTEIFAYGTVIQFTQTTFA
ncbi:hypothetical protein QQG09_08410 [Melissococcus plutonius]|uniref:Uncharacterized protein n=2 Tax=Melissococcus plutonius TaxID=33970 RepID=F3YCK9_MELPT|nr:hypothetical protein [Melissococcus plutonius]BAL62819.1 hypothetical protein MPD5_1634 [Melissococcus plutonius DAT561]AIM25418.1 hypothetical protein MEPL_c016890 [Melissococcus plutonius S1]KMT23739.1 hypothetical protein MEPL2_4c00240 [Melissococcus plutonius]KMT24323.1 hypothetical protein MEPL1_9c00240 [Melissococcus plutonius]KMT27007.1 hypothetical protein MEPL3_1c00240 [Melissococcus plutonius]